MSQVAMVTGAGQGIGKAIAKELFSKGYTIAACDINLDTGEKTAKELNAEREGNKFFEVDVTRLESLQNVVEEIEGSLGEIKVLVNTVGWDIIEPFMNNTVDYWEKVINLNFKSAVYGCKAVLPKMMERKDGRIINIGSDAGRVGSLGETVYAGTKGGVIAFSKSLAREMARYKISVNAVCPGPTDTPLFRSQPSNNKDALIRAIPLRRLAEPEDIAYAAAGFFCR
ncbi:SDR family oxidoreductase [Terrilactibacillus sp. S3-3]|nr:SDR family oxidoreductase [Terrilactibacillus sp. S3-3]